MTKVSPARLEHFKKRIHRQRLAIQNIKNLEACNLPTEGGLIFIEDDYDGPLEYGMAKIVQEPKPTYHWEVPYFMTVWWDGIGWRMVREPSGFLNTRRWSKYWTPEQSEDSVPVPGSETSLPKPQESGRHWWQFSRKSKHTNM